MIINHNISALNAHRMLSENSQANSKTLEKLSSGLRINRGADDAAGLAVSEKMRSQIRGMNMAHRNAQDGVSLLQSAEGYLQETTSAIQRMRELAVQAANGTYTETDRSYLQEEVNQLTNEVERIATQSEFNQKPLFMGNLGGAAAQAGLNNTGGEPSASIAADNPTTGGMPLHIGPNMDQRIIITINNMTTGALGLSNGTAQPSEDSPEQVSVVPSVNLTTAEGANQGIAILDKALTQVNSERTRLGSYQNRLDMTMRGISVASENLQAAESRVRDADMAKQMIDFVKLNILSQGSTSMLSQANLRPQLMLKLLG